MTSKGKVKVRLVKGRLPANNSAGASLVDFIAVIQNIKLDSPLAKLNATSISDNNGGRIEL